MTTADIVYSLNTIRINDMLKIPHVKKMYTRNTKTLF